MLNRITAVLLFHLLCSLNVFAELRKFDDIFPTMNQDDKAVIFSETGYVNYSQAVSGNDGILGFAKSGANLEPQILDAVLGRNPGYLVESVSIIPGEGGVFSLLDVYNALQNIQGLKGILYHSATRNQAIPLFENATRIVSERQTTAIPDPPPAVLVPAKETIFIKLKDANFGNSFYRGEMVRVHYGLCFTFSNFRSLTYLVFPVIREGNLTAQLYFEPIYEGILIYSIAGAEISDFLASRIHVNSAIAKRLAVIVSWASDGIRAKKLP